MTRVHRALTPSSPLKSCQINHVKWPSCTRRCWSNGQTSQRHRSPLDKQLGWTQRQHLHCQPFSKSCWVWVNMHDKYNVEHTVDYALHCELNAVTGTANDAHWAEVFNIAIRHIFTILAGFSNKEKVHKSQNNTHDKGSWRPRSHGKSWRCPSPRCPWYQCVTGPCTWSLPCVSTSEEAGKTCTHLKVAISNLKTNRSYAKNMRSKSEIYHHDTTLFTSYVDVALLYHQRLIQLQYVFQIQVDSLSQRGTHQTPREHCSSSQLAPCTYRV